MIFFFFLLLGHRGDWDGHIKRKWSLKSMMIFSLSRQEKEARENRGSSCRPSFVVVVRPSGIGKMRDVKWFFFSFWTCVPPSPSLSVGFRRWRRKEKETRWIAVINQTKRKRLGLGDWKWIEVTLSTDHARGPQLDDIIFSLIHSNKGQRGGIRQTTTLKCR